MENLKKSEDGKRKEKKYIKTKNKFSVQEDEMKKSHQKRHTLHKKIESK